jgi:hypothetical protein
MRDMMDVRDGNSNLTGHTPIEINDDSATATELASNLQTDKVYATSII